MKRVLWWIMACMVFLLGPVVLWAADDTYLLGPGDKITVNVLRHDELTNLYIVPPDGNIDFRRVGVLNVNGMTIDAVRAALAKRLAVDLRDPRVTVVLSEARTQYVSVSGAVAKPGRFALAPGARVSEALASAGDVVGERRELTGVLVRGDDTISLDLAAIFSGQDVEANLVLREDDRLDIRGPARMTVIVAGQVKNPGVLNVREGGTLIDVVAQAGDLLDRPEKMRISVMRGPTKISVAWSEATMALHDGDVVLIEREPVARIFVNGHVRNPGAYDLPLTGGVLESIALAGGVLDHPALAQVTIVRASGEVEHINLSPALTEGQVSSNPQLRPGDQVIVPESTAKIAVLGMVRQPGTFTFSDTKPLTVIDAIGLAGGTDRRAKSKMTTVIRVTEGKPQRIPVDVGAILRGGRNDLNIALRPNDIVFVPESGRPNWGELLDNLSRIGLLATLIP